MVKLFEEDEKLYNEMKQAANGRLGLHYSGGKYNKIEFKNL